MTTRTYEFSIECPLPFEAVWAALTDFSEKRTTYFPNLSRSRYEVLQLSDHTASVVEGAGPFFSQERYDWSNEGRIWSRTEESNIAAPGGMTDVHLTRRSDGGCSIRVRMERQFTGWLGHLILASATLHGGGRFYQRAYVRMLRNVARELRRRL